MSKTKDSFTFRSEWRDAISGLPEQVRLEIYEAIIEYGISGKLTDLKPMAMLAFNFAKVQIDRENERQKRISNSRREAGASGGNAKASLANVANVANASFASKRSKCKQNVANVANVAIASFASKSDSNARAYNNISNCNNKEDKKETTTKVVVEKEEERNTPQPPSLVHSLVTRQQAFYDTLRTYVGQYPADILRNFYDYWSEPNRSQTKMRMEMEKTWDVGRRLAYWYRREQEKSYGTTSRPDTAEKRAEDVASIIARLAAEDDAAAAK